MNIAPKHPPVWIDKSQSLEEAYRQLKNQPRIAVDTESNSLFAYKEKVCLIQISSPDIDYLFDPFEFEELSLLGELFNNPTQEKIFHASEYDLICLKRDFHFSFANIFDTMIAARILGAPQVGLGSLLQEYFEIALDKKYQRANWGLRPLPPEMLDYARLDTHYLFNLRDLLEKNLVGQGLLDLAREDFLSACKAQSHQNGSTHSEWWKVAGCNHMEARQATILQELCNYRDEQAKKADLPHFKVLSNELLVEISREKPTQMDDLRAIPHVSEKIVNRHGNGLLKAVSRGETRPLVTRQRTSRPDDDYIERIERLKDWRKRVAKTVKVESDVVLPKELMENIAAANPKNEKELRDAMVESPIRFQKYGNLILETLKKKE